ncbi:DUF4177 domain-containing protein [Ktedonospora formicarum]|nr:DUF4177 domain-containing protein [Ktedonospora formicarum]
MQRPIRGFTMEKQDTHGSAFIPMVYEAAQAAQWEYKVLTIDPREEALPDAQYLSELGKEGWVLTTILDERSTSKGGKIHYYLMRQSQ